MVCKCSFSAEFCSSLPQSLSIIRLCFAQRLNKFGRFCKELTAEKIELTSYSLPWVPEDIFF